MENDKCIEEIATLEEVEVIDNTIDTSNFITKDVEDLTHYTTTEQLEQSFATKEEIADFIKKDVDNLQNYTLTSDLERDYAKKDEIPSTNGFIKKDVTDLDNFYNQTEIDEKIDEETSDLLQGLSRELKPDEENGGFSSQTIVNVKNKNGATEMIMEIDNLDVKTDVATNSVLGTLKGQDLDERVQKLEQTPIKVIELHADITNDNRKAHVYPDLTLNEDELKIVIDNNISILKVTYNITGTTSDSETSELVFYTTIDNVTTIKGQNTVKTYKVNATRTNDGKRKRISKKCNFKRNLRSTFTCCSFNKQ